MTEGDRLMRRIYVYAGLLGALIAVTPQPAHAYIDPGIGSLLFQSAVAGFIAIGAAWAGFKMKILDFFNSRKKEPGKKR